MKVKRTQISIRVTDPTLELIDSFCDPHKGITRSDILREGLFMYFEKHGVKVNE